MRTLFFYSLFTIAIASIICIDCTKPETSEKPALEFSARSITDTSYIELSRHQLKVDQTVEEGKFEGQEKVNITIKNKGSENWTGILKLDYVVNTHPADARFFLPGFVYGKNRPETPDHRVVKTWPRLSLEENAIPFTSSLLTRGDRISHPIAMLYSNGRVYGIAGSPHRLNDSNGERNWRPKDEGDFFRFNGFGCELGKAQSKVSYTIGYENAPYLYICCRDNRLDPVSREKTITLEPEQSYTFQISLYNYSAENELGINDALKDVYFDFHQSPRAGAEPKTALQDLSRALFEDAYNDQAKNYVTSVALENDQIKQGDFYSIGWTGGLMVATPMLMAATRLGNEVYRQQAITVIQNMVDHALNESSGLPFDAYFKGEWSTNGWWEHYVWSQEGKTGHSTYVGGQAMYYLLEAYIWELTHYGRDHQDWLDFALKVSNQYETTKLENGEYPYRISAKNGKGVEYDSFGGSWCLATRALLYKLFPESIERTLIDQSIRHYWDQYLSKMECYGAPHDIWKATDEEGILGYIKGLKIMHEQTGDHQYLDFLQDAIDYEFSWKYMYNTPVQIPPLNNGWSSSGASGTSIANPHVHPMGGLITDDVLYLANQLDDRYYYSRLEDIYGFGLQSYNKKANELDFGKKGWMPERFCAFEGLVIEKYPDGSPSSTWFRYHSWAASCVVNALSGDMWER